MDSCKILLLLLSLFSYQFILGSLNPVIWTDLEPKILEKPFPLITLTSNGSFAKLIETRLCKAGEQKGKPKSPAYLKERRCIGNSWSLFNPFDILFQNSFQLNASQHLEYVQHEANQLCVVGQWSKKSNCAKNLVKNQYEYCVDPMKKVSSLSFGSDSYDNKSIVDEQVILSLQLNFLLLNTFCNSFKQLKLKRFLKSGGSSCLGKLHKLQVGDRPSNKPGNKTRLEEWENGSQPNSLVSSSDHYDSVAAETHIQLDQFVVIRGYLICFKQNEKKYKGLLHNLETFSAWFLSVEGKQCVKESLSRCSKRTIALFGPIMKNMEDLVKKQVEPERLPWDNSNRNSTFVLAKSV